MSRLNLVSLASSLLIGLAVPYGAASAQDDDSSVDCFYASNKSSPLCQSAAPATRAEQSVARTRQPASNTPEYGETVAESVDCFYAYNASDAACRTTDTRAKAHVANNKKSHGS